MAPIHVKQRSELAGVAQPRRRHAPFRNLHNRLAIFSRDLSIDSLSALDAREIQFDTDQPIWFDHDQGLRLYILETGFAYSFTILPGGQRHIDDFFGPGAICNWSWVRMPETKNSILFKAGSRAISLDAGEFMSALDNNPALRKAVNRHELARTMRSSQRTTALISLPAIEKLSIFLLDLEDEYRASGNSDEWLPLSLTQPEIADMIGMTPVHANRIFRQMGKDGALDRCQKKFKLTRRAVQRDKLDYTSYFNAARD